MNLIERLQYLADKLPTPSTDDREFLYFSDTLKEASFEIERLRYYETLYHRDLREKAEKAA